MQFARPSHARRHTPEPPRPASDHRSEFEHDRARIIHSAAFRRLQGKTQVFGVYEGDFFRTRLTHSLEVAQIAKGIALALGADTDLVETICLAHDLGHAPFGHAGERLLHDRMRPYGGFESNAQTFRIVTRLEHKHSAYPGLNLSYPSLDGLLKYKTCLNAGELTAARHEPVKGYYATDHELVEAIARSTGSGQQRSPECQIMDVADDIAYSVHDIEDSLQAGLITLADFHRFPAQGLLPEVNAALGAWQRTVDAETVGAVLTDIATQLDALEQRAGRAAHKMLTRDLISAFASTVEIQPTGRIDAAFSERLRIEVLKAFESHKVIRNPRVATLGYKGQTVLARLFEVLDRGRESVGLLPEEQAERYQHALGGGDEAARKRVICDFLASMTDSSAMRFYSRLFVPGQGSFSDML